MAATDPLPLLEALVRCPSVTPDGAGALDVLASALAPLGFAVERVTFSGDGSYPVENLFATRGAGSPHLMFCGHTDVVPPGDAALWTHPPFEPAVVGGRLYGRGSADMKSGIAAFVAALARVGETPGRVSLLITNDEEQDSVNGTDKLLAWAEARGERFDFAIVGEPSATARAGDSIKIGRRGSLNGEVRVAGRQGHVAYPDRALNPLPVLAAIATALAATRLDAGTAHFPPSNLELTSIDTGNAASNVVPARATLRFNIRHNDLWSPETLEAWIAARIGSVEPAGRSVTYARRGRPSPVFLSPAAGPVALLSRVIAQRNGAPPELSTAGGTSDARFIARHCPVVECGLAGPSLHQADEHIGLDDLEALTGLYAEFIRRYLGGEAS
jgi:succinyl-diaminopimelate desuccinylase